MHGVSPLSFGASGSAAGMIASGTPLSASYPVRATTSPAGGVTPSNAAAGSRAGGGSGGRAAAIAQSFDRSFQK